MKGIAMRIASLSASLLLMLFVVAGCSSNGNATSNEGNASEGATQETSTVEELTPDSHLFQLMNELTPTTTLDEANQIIGVEGEELSNDGSTSSYSWDLGDDCSIEAFFFSSGSAQFEAEYPTKLVAERADFSNWDQIEAQVDEGTLTYDSLVEMLGGVPGLKDVVRTGEYTYHWYDADGGYLFAQVDSENGEVDIVSGRF